MKKNIVLIIIWALSYSLPYAQSYEISGGFFLGPFATGNVGLNLNFSHSLDSSKYLQTEISIACVNYFTNHLKHSSEIYSIEENLIISNDRKIALPLHI